MDEELSPSANINEQTDSIMSLLGVTEDDDRQGEAAADTQSAEGERPAGDAAPETASGDEDGQDKGAVEPSESAAIEAPETFSAELKERFKALPADLQQTLAQWESERNRGVNQKLEEAAAARKAAEAAQAQLQPERQRLAQQLESAISLAQNFDPILAERLRMTPADWAKLAAENPAGYVQQKADFDARMGGLQAAVAERNKLAAENHKAVVARETEALTKAIPELADPVKAKAFSAEFSPAMASYGFTPEEIGGIVDHRMVKVARDAMLYRAGEKARQAAAAKAVKPGVPRVVKPGTGDTGSSNSRSAALLKRANSATSLHDQADALAALIDQG